MQLRFDTLEAHRRAVFDQVATSMTVIRGWSSTDGAGPAGDPADAAGRSGSVGGEIVGVGSGAALIAARLRTATRFAAVDVLLPVRAGGYVPVLIRGHRTTDPGGGAWITPIADLPQWLSDPGLSDPDGPRVAPRRKLRAHHQDVLALAHVYRLLQELGLAAGDMIGGIIGLGGSSTDPTWNDGALVAWHRLDAPSGGAATALADYDTRFADRRTVARAAARREPALAQPSKIAECRRCPWWTVCGPELEAAHDVSLLVAGGDVDILRATGVRTYDDVARLPEAELAALPLTGIPAAEARTRAQAMIAGVPLVRRTLRADVVRADVEFDIDMESYLDDGAYLWGTYLTGVSLPGFAHGYRPFVTWDGLDKPSTATNFVSFWQYLTALRTECRRRGYTFAAYCYSHKAEERWLYGTPARFPDEPGMPTRQEIAAFCASPQWVDLYQEIKRLFIVPGSLRLKAVAPIAGFAWRDSEPGGENSMAWYRAATGTPSSAGRDAARERNRERILRYNEDDVIATLRLRQWISENPTAMPTVAELATVSA